MTTVRNFVYAALLALTTLTYLPSPAAAQMADGKFTLSHDVHWGKAVVPAGAYGFSFDSSSPRILMLNKLSEPSAGFMIMVPMTEDAKPSDVSRLLLKRTSAGSYVSAMQLPEFGLTLDFTVPSHPMAKQIADNTAPAAAQ